MQGQLLARDGSVSADLADGVQGSDEKEGDEDEDHEGDEQVDHGG